MAISRITFAASDSKKMSSKTLRKVRSGMQRDGAIVFENLYPLDLLKKLRQDVFRRMESGSLRDQRVVRDIGGRYAALLPFEGPFLNPHFYANPRLRSILGSLLGADHCIGSLEVVVAVPGANAQHQHIDGPIRFDRMVGHSKRGFEGDLADLPPYAVTLCVPLCDVDENNGPTAIWPGSHRTALRARPPSESEILRKFPVEHMVGKFGRSFLFDFRTFHCGLPNDSREPRPLLMFVFTRTWYRDPNLAEVIPSIILSKKNFKRIPERNRQLFMLAPVARRSLRGA